MKSSPTRTKHYLTRHYLIIPLSLRLLKAIGLSDTEAMKTIRISLPIVTSKDYNDIKFDVDGLLVEIDKALKLFDMENNDGKS